MSEPNSFGQSCQSRFFGLAALYTWVGFVAGVTETDNRSFAEQAGVRTYLRPVAAAELHGLGAEFREATTVFVYEHCDFNGVPTGHRHRIFLRRVERPR